MNGNQVLYVGLETILNEYEFKRAKDNVTELAFSRVFHSQDEGVLQWKRADGSVPGGLEDFVANVVVKNGRGEEVEMVATLFIGYLDRAFLYLTLGGKENSPTRNEHDERVRKLYQQITGVEWKRIPVAD